MQTRFSSRLNEPITECRYSLRLGEVTMNNLSRYALMAAAIGFLSLSASAQTNAVSFSNTTGTTLANPPFTLGWSFTATSNIDVVDLGVFDDSQNGLTDSHQVGLWNSSGTLLVSTTVPSGTGATLDDQFRMVGVTSTELLAGQTYFIGALYTTGDDPMIFPGGATGFGTASQIMFDENNFAGGSTLTDPTSTVSTDPAYFGPNFEFNVAGPVPEPSSLMLLGTGVLGFAGMLKRRMS